MSDKNFKAKARHLKDDLFLYYRLDEEKSNFRTYRLALSYLDSLYDTGISSIQQFKVLFAYLEENLYNKILEYH